MKLIIISLITLLISCQAYAADIFDKSNSYIVENDGLIYDTSDSTYSETGEWKKDGVGFMEREKRTTQTAGAVASWDQVAPGDNGYYEIYIWKNVIENGDKNVFIDWFATGSSNGRNFMDCSQGKSGWQYLGTCNTSDLYFRINVKASGTGVLPVSCFRLVKTDKDAYTKYLDNLQKSVMVLKIGSDKALLNSNLLSLSMGKAVINNSRTMVPLRFVMEMMGAEVYWDDEAKKAEIISGENKTEFYIGRDEYTVNGEALTLDSPPYISEERTMIPIRALSEGLGKKVYWDDGGIVVIAEEELADYSPYVKQGLSL